MDPLVDETAEPYSYSNGDPVDLSDQSGLCARHLAATSVTMCPSSYYYNRFGPVEREFKVEKKTPTTITYFFEWRAIKSMRSDVEYMNLTVTGERPNGSTGIIGYNNSIDRRLRRNYKRWYAHTTFVAQRGTDITRTGTLKWFGPGGGSLNQTCRVP